MSAEKQSQIVSAGMSRYEYEPPRDAMLTAIPRAGALRGGVPLHRKQSGAYSRLRDPLLRPRLAACPILTKLGIRHQPSLPLPTFFGRSNSLSFHTSLLHLVSYFFHLSTPCNEKICAFQCLPLRSICNYCCPPSSCRTAFLRPRFANHPGPGLRDMPICPSVVHLNFVLMCTWLPIHVLCMLHQRLLDVFWARILHADHLAITQSQDVPAWDGYSKCGKLVLGQGAKILSGSTQGIYPQHQGS